MNDKNRKAMYAGFNRNIAQNQIKKYGIQWHKAKSGHNTGFEFGNSDVRRYSNDELKQALSKGERLSSQRIIDRKRYGFDDPQSIGKYGSPHFAIHGYDTNPMNPKLSPKQILQLYKGNNNYAQRNM